MNHDAIQLAFGKKLREHLYNQFSGPVVERVMREQRTEISSSQWILRLRSNGFSINQSMAPKYADLCKDVQTRLQFDEPIDFFIVNDSEMNAFVFSRRHENEPHSIFLYSSLVERLNDDELKFVIGHEIGHLIDKYSDFMDLVHFIFPTGDKAPTKYGDKMPPMFRNQMALWETVIELTADRYGFIASPSLDACVSKFFKMSSGMDTSRLCFNTNAYLAEVDKTITSLKEQPFKAISSSHPATPIRIKAIEYFSQSDLYRATINGGHVEPDKNLQEKENDLVQLLQVIRRSGLDTHRQYAVVSGGLLMATVDREPLEVEINRIISVLANYTIFPEDFFHEIAESVYSVNAEGSADGNTTADRLGEMFTRSVSAIIEQCPGERYDIFGYLIDIAMAGGTIRNVQITFLYELAEEVFGISGKEAAGIIGNAIRSDFTPRVYQA